MAGLLDYLEGIGETGATLGTGLLSGVVGAPYGLFKGITSGRYGSPDPMNPRPSDLRAMQMKPYSGLITDELLKSLGY